MARRHKGRFVKKEEMPTEMSSEEVKAEPKKSEEKAVKNEERSRGSFDTIALFVVGLIVGLALGGLIFYSMGTTNASTNDPAQMNAAGQKAVGFISKYLLSPGATVTLVNTTQVNNTGVYQLTINLSSGDQSQLVESYITRNSELICPSGIITADFEKDVANQTDNTEQPSTDPAQICAQMTKADKPVLEAYIVSRCPYGLQMQRIMAEIASKAPEAAQYMKARYIGSIENGKITSMHGDAEAQENLLQICVREEQPAKYWTYVGCYMTEGNTTGCVKTAGIDQTQLNACMNDSKRGIAYAQKDFDMASSNSVSGSPTLIMNGKVVSEFDFAVNGTNGRSAEAVKNLLCCGFVSQPSFCSTQMLTSGASTGLAAGYSSSTSGSSGSC